MALTSLNRWYPTAQGFEGFAVLWTASLRRPPEVVTPTKEYANRKTYLEQLIDIVGAELADFGGKGKCCGFPVLTANEESSLAMTAKHTVEAKSKGADCMVTPCPLCHLSLDGNQPRAEEQEGKSINLPILHLPQFLGLALGFSPAETEPPAPYRPDPGGGVQGEHDRRDVFLLTS